MPKQLWSVNGTSGDDFLVGGGGDDTLNGGDGDDFILGDDVTPFTYGTTTSSTGPANLDSPLFWSLNNNPFVESSSIPHTSIYVAPDAGQRQYSSVTVAAGETITVDVDFGLYSPIGVDTDVYVRLFDSTAMMVAFNDDASIVTDGGAGSVSRNDPFLSYTNLTGTAQTYTIEFSEFGGDGNFEGDETFVANISVTGHAVTLVGRGDDTLIGGEGADTLAGSRGNDTLLGGNGSDQLYGGVGDDFLDGGDGSFDAAWYSDAASAVVVNLAQSGPQNTGGAGVDTLVNVEYLIGSAYGDTLFGNAGGNRINAGGGNDIVLGGDGGDILEGEDGNDTIFGGSGDDSLTSDRSDYGLITFVNGLYGEAGNDFLNGWWGQDSLYGGDGDDTIYDPAGDDTIDGGSGTDLLQYWGSSTAVTVNLSLTAAQNTGGAGTDTITGIENLTGTSQADSLTGNADANVLRGYLGNDTVSGLAGNDTLLGESGDDTLDGGDGVDTAAYLYTGAGVSVDLERTAAQNTVGDGIDTLVAIENLTGSTFRDLLYGNAGANILDGGGGDDTLTGRKGNDTLLGGDGHDQLLGGAGDDLLDGGTGVDTANYSAGSVAVTVSLAITGPQNTGGAGIDTLVGVERLLGSSASDILTGDSASNRLDGGGGTDSLRGGAGNDVYVVDNIGDSVVEGLSAGTDTVLSFVSYTLQANVERLTLSGSAATNAGGNSLSNILIGNSAVNVLIGFAGNDTLTGGAGNDFFRFNTALSASTNVDSITDFSVPADTIQIDDDIFTAAGATGALAAAAFFTGSAAHDADDRVIYDSTTGNIYYDADGTGAAAKTLFAHVTAGLALTNADFQVIG